LEGSPGTSGKPKFTDESEAEPVWIQIAKRGPDFALSRDGVLIARQNALLELNHIGHAQPNQRGSQQ
jgi:hypothetical protein